ncbi:gamma-glutamyltransferase, partial [Candidatus Poribacteria bacterium]|nr:gamma-glutamyltransferase [Candidatus Poribacteria bacterium]
TPAGHRLATMMSPGIAIRDGGSGAGEVVAFGSGGALRIRSSISQFISHLAHDNLELRGAVDAWRYHYEEAELHVEGPRPEGFIAELRAMGYTVRHWPSRSSYFGGLHAVSRSAAGTMTAAADARRDGEAAVVE